MTKWEYMAVFVKDKENPLRVLNEAGEQGWELCGSHRVWQLNEYGYEFILKRPIQTVVKGGEL